MKLEKDYDYSAEEKKDLVKRYGVVTEVKIVKKLDREATAPAAAATAAAATTAEPAAAAAAAAAASPSSAPLLICKPELDETFKYDDENPMVYEDDYDDTYDDLGVEGTLEPALEDVRRWGAVCDVFSTFLFRRNWSPTTTVREGPKRRRLKRRARKARRRTMATTARDWVQEVVDLGRQEGQLRAAVPGAMRQRQLLAAAADEILVSR